MPWKVDLDHGTTREAPGWVLDSPGEDSPGEEGTAGVSLGSRLLEMASSSAPGGGTSLSKWP